MSTQEQESRWRPLEAMTIDELLVEKVWIDGELGKIKLQLEEARKRVYTTGEYADHDWYSRARSAQRIYGQRSQKIQTRLSALKREQKARNVEKAQVRTNQFKHVFMRLVRERLGEAEYLELCDLANAEVDAIEASSEAPP